MKILKDNDVIEVGDILMFGYADKEPTKIQQILFAGGFAGYTKGECAPDGLIFVLRMSEEELRILRSALRCL